jgi:tRNA pseudouridine55 synthase
MTSHDVISVLRRVTKIKQIGHTGTLDPFAEGVLPVCIGKATRLIEYLNDDKAYIGTVQLGKSTTTYDIEGETINISDKKVTAEEIESALNFFRGEIEQYPPIYSAIKVKGKKLYEYARKGEEVKIEPRKVKINRLEILEFNNIQNKLKILIECSKGTYIRSIANDLGEKLGTYGHLINLERIKAGKFLKENSVNLDSIKSIEDVRNNIINPLEYLDYPKYELNNEELKLISNGRNINISMKDGVTILIFDNKIAAIGECRNNIFECNKVFVN